MPKKVSCPPQRLRLLSGRSGLRNGPAQPGSAVSSADVSAGRGYLLQLSALAIRGRWGAALPPSNSQCFETKRLIKCNGMAYLLLGFQARSPSLSYIHARSRLTDVPSLSLSSSLRLAQAWPTLAPTQVTDVTCFGYTIVLKECSTHTSFARKERAPFHRRGVPSGLYSGGEGRGGADMTSFIA